jgi:hypothetical protein
MSCNFTSRLDLLPIERDPNANLESLIAGCSDVCFLAYGRGNPDLAGIGVRDSRLPNHVYRQALITFQGGHFLYFPTRSCNSVRAYHIRGPLLFLDLSPISPYQPLYHLAQQKPSHLSLVSALVCNSNLTGMLCSTNPRLVSYL